MTLYSGAILQIKFKTWQIVQWSRVSRPEKFHSWWHDMACTAPWTCMSLHVKCGMTCHDMTQKQIKTGMKCWFFQCQCPHSFKLCQRQCWEFLSSHNYYSYVFNVHCGSWWTWAELDPPECPAWGRPWPLLEVAGVIVAGASPWVAGSAVWLLSTWWSASWLAELPVATTSSDPDSTTTTDPLAISWPM